MKTPTPCEIDPVPWKPDLVGEYPGQRSYLDLGPKDARIFFCWCPPTPSGQPFLMGSPPDEPERREGEGQHEVTISVGFWLAQHPVNQRQWQTVMGTNPSGKGKGAFHPVDSVSWYDAQEFCRKKGLRLPTEREWEYACRAGTTTPFGIGSGRYLNAQMANFDGNYPYGDGREAFKWHDRHRTQPQGSFPPNAWGLQDMHGQLWEWCEDEYSVGVRVLRGGSWIITGWYARSAYRYGNDPGHRHYYFGFRPCPSSTKARGLAEAGGRVPAAERGGE